ncbi:MAG: arsenate reductase family protein [Thermomicrobiales bacterium]
MIEAYIYTSCTSCRKTVEQLKDSGVEFESCDYFRNRFTRDELKDVLTRAGLTPREILSVRSKVYKARSAEIDALDDDALLDLMLEEPTLLRRPLVIKDGAVVVGHNTGALADLIAS